MRYRDVLICTVGTSLLGNLNKAEAEETRKTYQQRHHKGVALQLLSAHQPDDRPLGAEINSITSINRCGLLQDRRKLIFLVSDTEDGAFIGQVLKQYYDHVDNPYRFAQVEVHTLTGLTGSDPQRFRSEGLRNLVRAIANVVRLETSNRLVINATGGYKAQISFAGMIGQALEIPVCYLFEGFPEVIELPPQPIALDLSFWLNNVETFFALDQNELEVNPVHQDEKFASLVDEITTEGQTLIGFSAVGQLFHEMYQQWFDKQRLDILPPPTDLAPGKKAISYEDSNHGRHRGLKNYLEKICQLPYVQRINTYYYNPDLPLRPYFRPAANGKPDSVEGGYSDGKAATKFNIFTTAKTTAQQRAVIADLLRRCGRE
ncbi:MAG: putative CRISPR-associated protein [Desulfobacca sp.]|uniref:putative CRISPR-associated protein n=1 Tax=Desulfobacca sp. TaxID=2067990 RepID=UPI004048EB60